MLFIDLLFYNNYGRWIGGELIEKLVSVWNTVGVFFLFLFVLGVMIVINLLLEINFFNL